MVSEAFESSSSVDSTQPTKKNPNIASDAMIPSGFSKSLHATKSVFAKFDVKLLLTMDASLLDQPPPGTVIQLLFVSVYAVNKCL